MSISALLFPPARPAAQNKTGHAAEQDRADVRAKRRAWFDGQDEFDPKR